MTKGLRLLINKLHSFAPETEVPRRFTDELAASVPVDVRCAKCGVKQGGRNRALATSNCCAAGLCRYVRRWDALLLEDD